MNSKPLLSICIATYNRARFIGETLESIISQATDEIEIIVADGASPDDTEAVVRGYEERCRQLHYHRLPEKGGVDRDYCHAVSFATADYCWLLTDDDILKPGAVKAVLALLPKKYSLIVINAEVWNEDLSQLQETKHLHVDQDRFYPSSSHEELFRNTVVYLSFIGAVVVNRALWNEREKETYIGTEFIHVGVLFQKELPDGAFVLAEPLIAIRFGNAQWTPRQFEIWLIKWPKVIWTVPAVSDNAKARITPQHPWETLGMLVTMRAYGAYSLDEYKRFLAQRITSPWQRLKARALCLVPGIVPNLYVMMLHRLRSTDDFIIWHNLRTSRYYYRSYFRNLSSIFRKAGAA